MQHPLISGSIILFLGTFLANFFNFVFSVVMGRMLTPADFGTLSSINAVITLPAILANAITPLVIILSGSYFAQKKYDFVRGLYIKLTKLFLIISALASITFFLFIPQINNFFNINNNFLLILTDIIIFLTIMSAINYSFIQAKLAFKFYVLLLCSITIIKLISGSILVFAGFKVVGGVMGILLGYLIPFFISFIPLKFVFNNQGLSAPKIDTKVFFTYGIPSTIASLGLSSFIINDLLLVKHYFSAETAGLYAGLSLLGRIIFFISSPISSVMFPLIVKQHSKNEKFTTTFLLALFLILLSSVALTAFYLIFPKFSISFILKKQEYFNIIPYLPLFSIYITIFSLVSIIGNFYLSIKKTQVMIPIIITALMQIILIILFHQTIWQIVIISLAVNSLLLLYFLIYYPFAVKNSMRY